MLAEFVTANRSQIIERCQARIATRPAPGATVVEVRLALPMFLDYLLAKLRVTATARAAGASPTRARDLLNGVTVAHVVHDYVDLCETIREVAVERGRAIEGTELDELNHSLDEAVAEVVTDFGRFSATEDTERATRDLGFLSHELRNLLCTAGLAFETIRDSAIDINSSTGKVLHRCLARMTTLVDRTLATVRLNAGLETHERVRIGELMEEVEVSALLEAKARGNRLVVEANDPTAVVEGDRQILASVIANLVQNAFKFTHAGDIFLRSAATADRVRIEVEDRCGGLPPGSAETLFDAYERRGADRSGLGLGLAVCLRGVSALGGTLAVRDLPGTGCVFTIDLPRVAS